MRPTIEDLSKILKIEELIEQVNAWIVRNDIQMKNLQHEIDSLLQKGDSKTASSRAKELSVLKELAESANKTILQKSEQLFALRKTLE